MLNYKLSPKLPKNYLCYISLVLTLMVGLVAACGSLDGSALTNPQEKPEVQAAFKSEPNITDGNVAKGGLIFAQQNCLNCHSLRGTGGIAGPTLDDVGNRAGIRENGVTAAQYLRHVLLHPGDLHLPEYRPIMPGVANSLNEAQVNDLVSYLLTLKSNS